MHVRNGTEGGPGAAADEARRAECEYWQPRHAPAQRLARCASRGELLRENAQSGVVRRRDECSLFAAGYASANANESTDKMVVREMMAMASDIRRVIAERPRGRRRMRYSAGRHRYALPLNPGCHCPSVVYVCCCWRAPFGAHSRNADEPPSYIWCVQCSVCRRKGCRWQCGVVCVCVKQTKL